jgi:antitoxin (DNA-binding transcriptional repressor) of toxin-antitoxin stability system
VKSINLASARRPLADYAADLGDEILVLTKGDRAVAAIVPLAEFAAGRKLTLEQMKRAVSPKRMSRKRARRGQARSKRPGDESRASSKGLRVKGSS